MARDAPPLPKGFHFGVATADHQCEAFDPRYPDIRDEWEKRSDQTARGRATDFWDRYREDIRLARGLGCTMFRFSVAWARVEPSPGVFNPEALKHYRDLVDCIVESGMEPMLTLHHYVWPLYLEETGGMLGDGFPAAFGRYAGRVAETMGDRVKYWVTINEPSELPFGFIKPWWTPEFRMPPGMPIHTHGRDQMAAVAALIKNLFLANREARLAIKELVPDALVGANPLLLGLPPWVQRLIDRQATGLDSHEDLLKHGHRAAHKTDAKHALQHILGPIPRLLTFLPTIVAADWWHLGISGQLAEFLCPPGCEGQQDFVGLDYYWGIRSFQLHGIQNLMDAAMGQFDKAPVWPGALRALLTRYSKLYPGQQIIVVENGCVSVANGINRDEYVKIHVKEVQQAVADGVNVHAYVCWSITSNREWGLPFRPGTDFGLYYVDLDGDPDLKRQSTPAAEMYKRIIEKRGV